MTHRTRNVVSSTHRIPLAISILGLVGMCISGYLTYVHYEEIKPVCLPSANCDAVLSSPYAQIWGVPISLLGLLMYAFLTGLGFLLWRKRGEWQETISLGIYTTALSGLLFTLYLYYLEIFEIHDFCTWCIASSLVILVIFMLSLINLFARGRHLREIPRLTLRWISQYIGW